MNVPEPVLQFQVQAVLLRSAQQRLQHPPQGMGRTLELDDFTEELVDPAGNVRVCPEQLVLDLIDIIFQPGNHGLILVHDFIQNGVQHRLRAQGQQLGAASSRRRTRARSGDSACRMLTAKSGPTKTCSSPNSTFPHRPGTAPDAGR